MPLRWWICTLLFASTVINYIDRQTLSLLAPDLKKTYHWTNSDYALIVVGFRVAYAIGQTVFGRLLDRVGTRQGLTLTVAAYSLISVLTSLANGFYSFATFRFLLGAGESGNWPGATKAVSEWFPKHERGLATAFFDSGSSVGGAIAPFIVLYVYANWGLRLAFITPGLLGFLWLIVWRATNYNPSQTGPQTPAQPALGWGALLTLRQTWGSVIARSFTDPVWFFITDWFPIYLASKGISLTSGLIAVWIPFIAADLGNFFGGIVSGRLIKRGWSVGSARKSMVILGGVGMLLIVPSILTVSLPLITLCFALATFSYGVFTTIANVLPADLFPSESVATVSGISGAASSAGTIVAFLLIGKLSDTRQVAASHSFDPIVIAAGLIPFLGMILVLLLVRNDEATESGLVYRI